MHTEMVTFLKEKFFGLSYSAPQRCRENTYAVEGPKALEGKPCIFKCIVNEYKSVSTLNLILRVK